MLNNELPKKIHYCWFGGNPLNELAKKCIQSWKVMCPDFEIIEWNETNFDVNCCEYVKEAYANKKWAFVSDYARFKILYDHGGIYFDTDVELIKPINDIIEKGPFMGFENNSFANKSKMNIAVNSGLGLGSSKGHPVFYEVIEKYKGRHFLREDGTFEQYTIVQFVTDLLLEKGLQEEDKIQIVEGITIYPTDYFAPLNYENGIINKTKNTRSIHHYSGTWLSKKEIKIHQISQGIGRVFGTRVGYYSKAVIGLPYQISVKCNQIGWKSTCKFIIRRLFKRKN